MADSSFKEWLIDRINEILKRKSTKPPFIVWCDTNEEWLKLLQLASEYDGFELWAGANEPELLMRDAFFKEERRPRVVRLSCSREDISWFKVFELEADYVWEKSLLNALKEYGVKIPREHESEIVPMLRSQTLEWFDEPMKTWRDLTPSSAKGTLIDDRKMLEILAGDEGEFEKLKKNDEERFKIFSRRAVDDFGFPDPSEMKEDLWRVKTTARLLATEAAECNPMDPPSEGDNIIPKGIPRNNALQILNWWKSNIDYLESFEKLSQKADKTLGLSFWAKSLTSPPKSYSSHAVEVALFSQMVENLDKIEEIDRLVEKLEENLQAIQDRTKGKYAFWEKSASDKIGWSHLLKLAETAGDLTESKDVEKTWKGIEQAIEWYVRRGWVLDKTGESLFAEKDELPSQLHRIRARIKKGYLRKVDKIGTVFSDLLTKPEKLTAFPTVGEVILEKIADDDIPTAIMYLDALSFYLGNNLKDGINYGEPSERATIGAAIAPLPSITPFGMSFALPMKRDQLTVEYRDVFGFHIFAAGFQGNLFVVENRRKWFKQKFGVKDFYSISDVLDSEKLKRAGKSRNLIVVEGQELDKQGHEGELEIGGSSDLIERYARAIRHLRDAGYKRIIVATDHGFFHWQPEDDEIQAKPEGETLWKSRRAIVGHNLKHSEALKLPVPCSDLEVMVPRSVNAFETYGGLGYFHGGASLQEMVIPVLVVNWPVEMKKLPVVLKPVEHITSERPRVQVQAGITDDAQLFKDTKLLSRRVKVKIKILDSGKLLFKHDDLITIEPGGEEKTVQLEKHHIDEAVQFGTKLLVEVIDADTEESLSREEVTLKVEIDEWY